MRDKVLTVLFGGTEAILTGVAMSIFLVLGIVVVVLGVIVGVVRWTRNTIDAQVEALINAAKVQKLEDELKRKTEEREQELRQRGDKINEVAAGDAKADPVEVANKLILE